MDYGEKIYNLRKQKSLSQETVANKLNVSRQSVSLWETNQSSPSMENFVALAKLFQVSLDELVGIKDLKENKEDPLYSSNFTIDKTAIYRRDHYYLYSKKDAILAFVTTLFFSLALSSFIGALQVREEHEVYILIMGFVSLIIGYMFYPLYMMINIFRNGKNGIMTFDFFENHIEVVENINEKIDLSYNEISYYIAKKGFLILIKRNGNRLYIENQFSLEFNDFLASKIEKRNRTRAFWKV